MMFKIAELLPGDQEGILGCCNPPPPLVRLHVQELHRIVERARHYNPLLDPANTTVNEAEYTPGTRTGIQTYIVLHTKRHTYKHVDRHINRQTDTQPYTATYRLVNHY